MRAMWAGVAAVAVVAAGAPAAGQDAKIDAKLLVGKWQQVGISSDVRFEFTPEGKVHISVKREEQELKADGSYTLAGTKLTVKIKFMGNEQTQTRTVTKLTATEFASADEQGREETLQRVVPRERKKTPPGDKAPPPG